MGSNGDPSDGSVIEGRACALGSLGESGNGTGEMTGQLPRSASLDLSQGRESAFASPSGVDAGVSSALVQRPPALTVALRTALLLFGQGMSIGLFVWAMWRGDEVFPYAVHNRLPLSERRLLALGMVLPGILGVLAGLVYASRHGAPGIPRLHRIAVRLSPVLLVGLLPFLFRWQIWVGRELTFAVLASIYGIAAYASILAALQGTPLTFHSSFPVSLRRLAARAFDRLKPWLPFTVVLLGAIGYAAYFSYYTIQNHNNLGTASFDLGLENNLMWNLVNGGPFMKSSPLGYEAIHFGFHATLFAYVMAPVYALWPRPETLLVIQAVMIGAAALPLYGFARRHIGRWGACVIALCYLLYPPVHGSNLYDFHYLPLGVFFLWLTLYLIEGGRYWLAALAVLLTLSVREDVAAGLVIIGAYLILSGSRPRAGAVVGAVAATYFFAMKMVVMPAMQGGGQSFIHQWEGLAPEGARTYGGVLMTVLANPVFTLTSLLEPEKFLYLAQLGAPLCFFPWRRPIGLFLSLPGFFFTLLSTKYLPLVQISFQYTAHWTTFLFIAVVANLAALRKPAFVGDTRGRIRQRAWLLAIGLSTLVTSHQYGAILQQNTARGGFGPYRFERTDEDRERQRKLYSLIEKVPDMAKIVSSENIVPHVSSRPDSYTLRVGVFDADYLLFSLPAGRDELPHLRKALEGPFGIVEIREPFYLAKRGHSKDRNEEVMKKVR